MTIIPFTGGLVETNGYLVETTQGTVVIDAPGGMAGFLAKRNTTPLALLLTHQHFDHVEDAAAIARKGVPIHALAPYSHDLILDEAARRWGLPINIEPFEISHLLEGSKTLQLAGIDFTLLTVPGHSPDSLVFHVGPIHKLFAGDTLFAGSIGRTDLPGGDHALLLRGIRDKLFGLPGETEVLPGHGPVTTVGRERAENPFLA